MKNIEYTQMAHLYDEFYKNKNYAKEVEFITNFIDSKCKILDVGCGTGNHAKILNDLGYDVDGFDQSEDMIKIANTKVRNHFFKDDLLTFKSDKKYDLVISFFAVFNHLKNYAQFKAALINLKRSLKDGGTIIIDLHNPQKSGQKNDKLENIIRTMKWRVCKILKKEFTKITYIVNGKNYKASHTFKVFEIKKLQRLAEEIGFFEVEFYENYDVHKNATKTSKNIQMVLKMKK